jgi:hypothetical protein
MKRRAFILISAVSAITLGIPWVSCRNRASNLNSALSQPQFLAHICDEREVFEIGTQYRKQVPEEVGETQLVSLLLTDGTGKSISASAEKSSLDSWLDRRTRSDFETGRTVIVRGWVLSVTEARQCAVYSITRP